MEIKARKVRVTGPRGMLYRELKHVNVEFTKIEEKKIRAAVYHGYILHYS